MQDYIPGVVDINGQIDDITVKQYDHLSRRLHLQFVDGDIDEPFDLNGCAARMYIEPSTGAVSQDNIAYIDGEIEDGDNGVVSFSLPNSVTQEVGSYHCEICITDPANGGELSTRPFTLNVIKSIRRDGAIEKTPQFSALQIALQTVDGIGSETNAFHETVADLQEQIDAATTSLTNMQTKLSNAITNAKLEGNVLSLWRGAEKILSVNLSSGTDSNTGGGSTGDNTGGSTGGSTGDNTGDSTGGGSTGDNTGGNTGSSMGGTPITSPETATEVVNNIKIGWNLGNTLDCSYDPVRLRDDSGTAVLGTEYEGIGYEIGWGDAPATTQAMFEALVNAGFNAIRIPITWNHHLRDAALPDNWGQDKTYTSEIDEYPNLSGNIIISPYFLNRVKTVVNYALNAGFRYVIINSHHDTADYNVSRPFGYAKKVTGLPWITEIPYQLFHASNILGSTLTEQFPSMTAEEDHANMCDYMRQLWTLIATAFKDYDYRVIFEGFNEILKYTRTWEEPTALQVARVNGFNNAFVSAVRNAGGSYNANRILSCETYAAYASNDALSNFSVIDSAGEDRIILQAHFYHDNPAEFANAAQRINDNVGIPAIFGEVGWSVNSSAPSDLYSFGYNLVQQAKSKGVKVFWWDNNKMGSGTNLYGLLNRWANGTEWHRPELLRGLIAGSNS